jgi:protein-S-isoprenylcysteine O-methyltransferase Ste14
MSYLFALILGFIFSAVWPIRVFQNNIIILNISSVILLLSSLLILWAQKSTKKFGKENVTKKSFMKGPYRYMRNPTNTGLFLASVSFGIIINSPFIIGFTLMAFFFSLFVFLKQESLILEKKYGEAYLEYKKTVRF